MNLSNAYDDVKKFHLAFEHPVGDRPQRLDRQRKMARLSWMQEELDEFLEADTLQDEVDAIIDEIYFNLGTLVEMGIDPQPIFDIVQRANMAKLWPDGKVHKNESGKTVKPPEWQDPQPLIAEEIDRQMKEALLKLKATGTSAE